MSTASASPTLRENRSYLSLIARVPAALAEHIVSWRLAQGASGQVVSSIHITVLIAHEEDGGCALTRLRQEFAGHGAIEVQLGEPASFEPVAPVTYLPLGEGAACFSEVHQRSIELVGPSASPFDYTPHLTLAHGLGDAARAASLEYFQQLPEGLDRFEVTELAVYRFTEGSWEHLGDVPLT
ncbi:MAG: 2'-5' RNA ligase family protein [Rothia sp. (in: high G+C Gram-positive bacteria)]|nr:2'-5' RNA ligase family protein [Rothia sp. (in: high G+C Gram-positive bacteria)]